MPSENEIAVGKFWDAFWSKADKSVAEEIFDPGFRDLDPNWPSGAEGGIPAMLEKNDFYFGLLPDLQCTVLKQLVVDDHVVSYWEASGTHQGEWRVGDHARDQYLHLSQRQDRRADHLL